MAGTVGTYEALRTATVRWHPRALRGRTRHGSHALRTLLFLGMVDDATTFAETRGGGGGGSDLKWGRDDDEDNRAWALRCMRMASRMMRPAIGKKPKR